DRDVARLRGGGLRRVVRPAGGEHTLDHPRHARPEGLGAEGFGVGADPAGVEVGGGGVGEHGRESLDDAVVVTGGDVDAAEAGHDGVEGAALPHRDDGGAAGHRFDGDDAEILDTWHEQGVAAAVHVDQDVVGGGAEEGGLGTGEGFQVAAVAAVADDDQTTAGAAGDADGQVGALVGDQTAG